jgi:ADP-heptose:LPS heptosyltransferase
MPPRLRDYDSLSPRVRLFLWLVDRVGAVLLWPARVWPARRGAAARPIEKILLLRCDGIGDLVLTTPALRAVRRRFPAAQIDLVVGPWAASLAPLLGDVDRVLTYASWGYRRLRGRRDGLGADWRFAREMRRERYDLAIDLRGDLLSLFPLLFWRVPRRCGRADRGGEFTLTDVAAPASPDRVSEIDRTLDVAAFLGADPADRRLALAIPAEATARAAHEFAARGIAPARLILFCPEVQWPWRRWPKGNFVALGRRLIAEGFLVGVDGSPANAAPGALAREIGEGAHDLTGAFDLAALAAAFTMVRGFVGVDSGPHHLAAAVGARGVVLFGPTDVARFGSDGRHVRTLAAPCPMRPCHQRGDCARPQDWCMAKIAPAQVADELLALLSEDPPPSSPAANEPV